MRQRLHMLAAARAAAKMAMTGCLSSIMCLDEGNAMHLLARRAPQLFPEQRVKFVFSATGQTMLVAGGAAAG
jgi:hypothetical protein